MRRLIAMLVVGHGRPLLNAADASCAVKNARGADFK
jgi:hypothetical protein